MATGAISSFVKWTLAVPLLACVWLTQTVEASDSHDNENDTKCLPGLILPVWQPSENLSTGDRVSRAVVYFLGMIYLFVGVSIIADRFMESIEVITSKEKEVKIKRPNGETQIIVVRVWNETVANLTLMALGSSAPEILLSIVEMFAKHFEAGDLGPGTIVGSAAFNLFVIIGLCCYVIPDGETRYIKHLRVYIVTAAWSIFAYIWLYFILAVSSYGEVEIWEAVLTFMFFPITVITAYIADRRLLYYKYLSKGYRLNRRGMIVEHEDNTDVEMSNKGDEEFKTFEEEEKDENVKEFERHRREYIQIMKDLRKKHPNVDMESLEAMAREEILNRGPKSRAFYRIQATRKLTGGQNLYKKAREQTLNEMKKDEEEENAAKDSHIQKVFFDPGHYTVMENVGSFEVLVSREGGDLNTTVLVDYKTEDGTANDGTDYMGVSGTLEFNPGELHKTFSIEVIDDDVFEDDEHFYIRLSNLRVEGPQKQPLPQSVKENFVLDLPAMATVMILDDDHGGLFNISERDIEIVESVGTYELKITRWSGARGRVALPYKTSEGTAKPGKDYEETEGEIIFENNQPEGFIPIQIIEEDSYEKDVLFYVEIFEPRVVSETGEKIPDDDDKIAQLGKPKLGEITRTQIRIKESKEFKNTVDKLVKRANASILVGSSSWKDQFIEALTVSAGDDDDDGDEGEGDGEGDEETSSNKMPSCGDYIIHFITLFWKLLFAFVPPTDMLNGYVTFVVSIIGIGMITALLGDFASHLGCTIGLKDGVNAIAFVALGTSIPDTFASKVAAIQDDYADASVGNVTGSNAVNVFLGIGIAWSMAAFYHYYHGRRFYVSPGNLGFSVTVFCSLAVVAVVILALRRHKAVGGELGGPKKLKIATSIAFVCLWMTYVLVSSFEAYGYIQGF